MTNRRRAPLRSAPSRLSSAFRVLLIGCCGGALLRGALGTATPAAAANFAILDQTIQTSFEPVSVSALVYDGAHLRQFDADFVPVPNGSGNDRLFRVAAVLPLDQQSGAVENLSVTFFLVSVDGDFAATTIQNWNREAIEQNSKSRAQLEQENEEAKAEIPKQKARNDALERELERSKDRASNVAEVEDIIGMKSALDQLKDSDSSAELELVRLHELIRAGRTAPAQPNLLPIRAELSKQLQEVTIATASSEHIRSSRRQSASTDYFHKLELARQAEGVDIRGLAAQVLELRQRRKELEARLGVTAAQLLGSQEGTTDTTSDTGGEF